MENNGQTWISKSILKIIIGIIILIIGNLIWGIFGPPSKVTVTNPQPEKPKVATDESNSINEYNNAYISAMKVTSLLKQIKQADIMDDNTDNELINNLTVIEVYYRKTRNCTIGSSLKDFINYYISINENAPEPEIKQNVSDYKKLKQDIIKYCGQ